MNVYKYFFIKIKGKFYKNEENYKFEIENWTEKEKNILEKLPKKIEKKINIQLDNIKF